MDDHLDLKAGSAMVLVVILLLVIVHMLAYHHDTTTWNNGCHASDGGKWEYQQMVGHKSNTYYAYKCSKCGKIVEFLDYRQEVEE